MGLPRWNSGKEALASSGDAGDVSSTPGSGRSSGEGNGNPLQYYCLENSMDSGTWCVIVHGVAESDITKHACMHVSDTFISFVYSIRYVSNYFSQNGQLIQFSSVQFSRSVMSDSLWPRESQSCMDVRVGLWRKLSAKQLMLLNCGVGQLITSTIFLSK